MSAPLAPLVRSLATNDVVAAMLGTDARVAVAEAARPWVFAAVANFAAAPVVLVVTATANEADRLAHDLGAFVDAQVLVFPAWETLPFERLSPSTETMGARLRVLGAVAAADPVIVVAPVKALLQRLGPGGGVAPVIVRRGDVVDQRALAERLVALGYRREYQVERRGEFAVRGGIVDVFPATGGAGVRIDCLGDVVDRLSAFDVAEQRSLEDLDEVEVGSCAEFVPTDDQRARAEALAGTLTFAADELGRIAAGETFEGIESFLPWLAEEERLLADELTANCRIVLVEPRRLRDRALELIDEEDALASALATTWGTTPGTHVPRLHLGFDRLLARAAAPTVSVLAAADAPGTTALRTGAWPVVRGDLGELARRAGALLASGATVVVAADGAGSAARLADSLEAAGLEVARAADATATEAHGVIVVVAPIERGFIAEDAGLGLVAESDITGRRRPHRVPRPRARVTEGFFDDLAAGGFVVHHVHGVARFEGIVRRSLAGTERDYLLLEYRGGDRLYVPSDQIDAITPYTGGEAPTLNRLNGSEWQRQRARVRGAVRAVAQELVVLYQRRLASPGHAFGADTPWQHELEQSFPFPETRDQLRAIDEVKEDMERPVPMDRLVCGDVGFGKTEVAVRAVFKAVQDGVQAAVLVPTTLLAQQHFQTFAERYAPYPVRVEMLSRFLTPAAARRVVAGIADGTVDVVVGTHRLLADDVRFRKLGLLVVDEEQRFGVGHKERVKALKIGVDVLTLTASPIPRTLEMGLTGIRDLSVINTPPAARQPILTYVGEYDERAVAEAMRRELLREGQVFYVHNRVADIERAATRLRDLVPEARVAVAHGQMDEGTLEQVVVDFADGRYDVLVCTTIIESGIDMPTVNTLVVARADLLGLGQLHQLRGRVGRAGQRAYAYLFHPADRALPETAYERLKTIGELTELGSGFKIAMRDLEIRGAGNLLGTDQSGHIAAVGYDLYVRMVAEAVAELKGEPVAEPAEIKIEVPGSAHVPTDYIGRDDLRLEAYRRLAAATTEAEVDDVAAEWADRFGPVPEPAARLLVAARLRTACRALGITDVTVAPYRPGYGGPGAPGGHVAKVAPVSLRASAEVRLQRIAPGARYKQATHELLVPLGRGAVAAAELRALLGSLFDDELAAAGARGELADHG